MDLSEIFRALGRNRFDELIKSVSMGSLKTYQVFETFKIHTRLGKLNRERLRRAAPQLWERLENGDQELARELSQGVLVSNLSLVVDVLDFLEIPHDGSGFFQKDGSVADNLKEGWQKRVLDHFRETYPETLLLLYVNHLDWEAGSPDTPFLG